jgi:hypothetical protein
MEILGAQASNIEHLKFADRIGFCGSAPEGLNVYRSSLTESLLSPSGAAYPRSDVAPDGACEPFLSEAINIPRRWRFPDTQPTKSGAVSKFEISEGGLVWSDWKL